MAGTTKELGGRIGSKKVNTENFVRSLFSGWYSRRERKSVCNVLNAKVNVVGQTRAGGGKERKFSSFFF